MNFEREARRKAMGGVLKLIHKEILKTVADRRKRLQEARNPANKNTSNAEALSEPGGNSD